MKTKMPSANAHNSGKTQIALADGRWLAYLF